MREITDEELNELFVDMLERSSSKILTEKDEVIEHQLFEEFDVGVISFLHEKSLDKLLKKQLISGQIKNLSLGLREKAMFALQEEIRNACAVKTSKNWREIFQLSDRILALKKRFDESKS